MKSRPFYQLGDDDYPNNRNKHWHRDILISAAVLCMIWIGVGTLVFVWLK
jgi:hypothetical protein